MENYLIYIGKSALAAAAFYLVYLVLFQNQKQFLFNRIYLPVSLALSFIIPLITFTSIKYIEITPVAADNSFAYLPDATETTNLFGMSFEWFHYLFAIYGVVALGFLIYLLMGHLKAISLVKRSFEKSLFEILVNVTKRDVHPFSFFNKIVLSENTLKHPNLKLIVEHENIHVKEKHTLDILFAEILFLLQWFNPFAWLIKDAIKNNLEYKTDHQIAKTNDPKAYQLAMVTLADKEGIAPFLTALNGSQLKNRIIMMKKKTENKYAFLKQLVVLPFLAILVMGLSNKEVKTEIVQNEIQNEIANYENQKKEKVTVQKEAEDDSLITVTWSEVDNQVNKQMNIYVQYLGSERAVEKYFKKSIDSLKVEMHEVIRDKLLNKKIINEQLNTIKDDKKVTIKGKVTDKNGAPISGASILIKGKPIGTISDPSGNYEISLEEENETLVFMMVGFEKQEINVEGKTEINVKLKNESEEITLNTPVSQTKNGDPIFYKVEEMPQFPGGEKALKKYIENSVKYPVIAAENGIQGKVYVTFIIDKNGKVNNPQISRGVDPVLDKEALRVVNALPRWKPGKQRGKIVNVSYTVPVDFVLTNELMRKYNKLGLDGKPLKKETQKREKQSKLEETTVIGYGTQIKPSVVDAHTKAANTVFLRNKTNGDNPLYIVDGKEVADIIDLDPEDLESISVLKDASATSLYGDKGKSGVILITTKEAAQKKLSKALVIVDGKEFNGDVNDINPDNIKNIDVLKNESATRLYGEKAKDGAIIISTINKLKHGENSPLIIIDGVQSDKDVNDINPETIQSINVLKDESATEKYGTDGKNGVIEITMKPEKIDTDLKLRKFIAKNIKYPVLAQEANREKTVYLAVKIDKSGKLGQISENVSKLVNYKKTDAQLDEVVVVAYKNKEVVVTGYATKAEAENAKKIEEQLLANEAKRVINKIPEIDISNFKGKTIGIAVSFKLQE